MNNLDNGNIIYDKDSALICLNCKFNLNINDINIKNIKCGNCNKELKNYQLISCNKCNYNFLLLHNYVNKEQHISESFKIYTQLAEKIGGCTHLTKYIFITTKNKFENI